MRSPTLGGNVVVLVKANDSTLRDDRVWSVWSQSPDGWWLMRRPVGGGVPSSGTTSPRGCSAPRAGR